MGGNIDITGERDLIRAGKKMGRKEMIPWMAAAAAAGCLLTIGTYKGLKFLKKKLTY